MIRALLFLAGLFAFATSVQAQLNPRYLVLFKDKTNSPFSIQKPADYLSERAISRRNRQGIPVTTADLPVNPAYVEAVQATGAKVIYSSRWFNGTLVEASGAQLAAIRQLSAFRGIELDLPVANITTATPGISRTAALQQKWGTTENISYGNSNSQLALMKVQSLHSKGFQGENMLIAVLDNGFFNAETVAYLSTLRLEQRIADTHDFVARDNNVYNDGVHGLSVLSAMAAYDPGKLVGSAFQAQYALYRTENDAAETPYEEITWLLAAERADSLGADVINTSLGYSTFEGEFNTPAYNHTYADMDGKTTIISRAARFATRTGMIVVAAAGNEGSNAWRYITAPADVDSVLTVGATTYDRSYAALSSIGPNAADQQKPDVAAVGAGAAIGNSQGNASSGNGTSFAAPQVAGLAAVLWQAHPELTAQQIIYALKKSGHQADNPDNLLGYGVPDAEKAEMIIAEEFSPLGTEKDILQSIVLSPNPAQKEVRLSIPPALTGKSGRLTILSAGGAAHWTTEKRLDAVETIPSDQLTSGLYLLRIEVAGREKTLKFLRQ